MLPSHVVPTEGKYRGSAYAIRRQDQSKELPGLCDQVASTLMFVHVYVC